MLIVLLVTVMCVLFSLGIHYEILRNASRFGHAHRARGMMLLIILACLVAHMIEIFIFAIGLEILVLGDYGTIRGPLETQESFSDVIYFSGVTYSTLGYGDLIISGPMRIMAAVEALTGLVLVGWTTSFSFLQMRRLWGRD